MNGAPSRAIAHPGLTAIWAVLAWCAAPSAAQPGAGTLTVELSPAEITVGDRVEARVVLEWAGPEPVSEPRFPVWQENWGTAEVLSVGEFEALRGAGGRRTYRQRVVLTAFRPGRVELPGIAVDVPLETGTVDVGVDAGAGFVVRSVLGEATGELAPRPPAPLQALAPGSRFAWTAGALAVAGLGMLGWLARRLAGGRGGREVPSLLEPLDELLDRLRRLDPRAGEPTHTALSLGLRRFLGRTLDLRAVEATTSEIQRRLGQAPVEPAAVRRTVRLLSDCDQVKFARLDAPEALTRGRLQEVGDLAREIDDGLRALSPESAEALP